MVRVYVVCPSTKYFVILMHKQDFIRKKVEIKYLKFLNIYSILCL